ncbi:MAG TPA: DMT family transporter [Gemmatimonadaceae bacterium]|jgi:drug/metabolite transporter (DMT)-like permease|nr:DMT family transporter [Gemmatimonadaceae bacterium]
MARLNRESYIAAMESQGRSVGAATAQIVVSALSFGSISVLTVLTTGAGVPLLTIMAWRYVLGALLLSPTARPATTRSISRRQAGQLLLIGGFGQALITYLSLYSLRYIPVGPLAFLFYTYPAWVAAIAALRRTERLTLVRVIALVLALVGVTVMVGAPVEKLNPVGVGLALTSALLYSIYLPALEYVQEGVPPMFATFLLILGAAVTFVIAAALTRELFTPREASVWTNIVLLAVVSTVIAFSTLIKGLSVLGPVRTAIIATVEPFFTAILGVLVLGNHLGAATIVGGVLIAAAILIIEWSSTRRSAVNA